MMTETLDFIDQTMVDHQELAQRLLVQAKADGVELVGPNGLLNQLTANVLEVEMDEHLGYEKRQRRWTGEILLSLSAKGLTVGEIAAHVDDVYGASVSQDTISPYHRQDAR